MPRQVHYFFPEGEVGKVDAGHTSHWESPSPGYVKVKKQKSKEPTRQGYTHKSEESEQLVTPGVLVDSRVNPDRNSEKPCDSRRGDGQN